MDRWMMGCCAVQSFLCLITLPRERQDQKPHGGAGILSEAKTGSVDCCCTSDHEPDLNTQHAYGPSAQGLFR
jgi:hypothetical protein